MTRRFAPVLLLSSGITFLLFWIMTALIRTPAVEIFPDPIETIKLVKVIREQPPPPPPPRKIVRQEVLPEPFEIPSPTTGPGPHSIISIPPPNPGTSQHKLGPLTHESANTDAIPLVRVAPRYPPRAMSRQTEGRVLIEFSVDRRGAVQNARVLTAEPPNIFEAAALKAVEQWRYNPKIVDGRPVERHGLKIAIPFTLGDR